MGRIIKTSGQEGGVERGGLRSLVMAHGRGGIKEKEKARTVSP